MACGLRGSLGTIGAVVRTLRWGRSMKKLPLSLLILSRVLVITMAAHASGAEPSNFVSDLAADTIAVLSEEKMGYASRQSAFRGLLAKRFDLPLIARFVAGRYWRSANPSERANYLAAFEDYLVGTFTVRFDDYSGQQLQIMNDRELDEKDVLVASEIIRSKAPAIRIDWRLRRSEAEWRIIDISVEGVSMALAQRSEFAAVIRAKGGKLSTLTDALRAKADYLVEREVVTK